MIFKKFSIISNLVALLASVMVLLSVWGTPASAAGCEPEIYFAITDPVTGNVITQAPQNGNVLFYVKLTPKGDCSVATINDIVINQRLSSGTTYLASFPVPAKDALQKGVFEAKYTQGVSGLLDTSTGKPVQVGGKVSLEGAVKLTGETNYRNSAAIPLSALAATSTGGGNGNDGGGTNGNVATGNGNEGTTVGAIGTISNPIGYESLGALVVGIIRFLLTMIGGLAVLMIIWGAVRMVASQGNEKAVTAGKQTVTWAVIGLITALMAFSLISLVQSLISRK